MGIIEDEALRMSATRVSPQGNSTIYQPPAGQVPAGAVTAGIEPMPARSSFIQAPPSGINAQMRDTLRGASVSGDGGLAQSLASRGGPMNTPAPTAAPVSPGPIRAAAGSISSAAGKAVGAMQTIRGDAIDDVKYFGRMAQSAAKNPIVKGVGTTAGLVAGGMTTGLAVDSIQQGNTALGAAQGALAASSLLPGPIGAAGRMANVGYQAIVGTGAYDKGRAAVQRWLNGDQSAAPQVPAQVAPAAQASVVQAPTEIAAAQKAPVSVLAAAGPAAPGGLRKAPGPVQRAGAAIADKLPAGSKQIMPPFAGKDADGPFWLFKRDDGTTYKDRPDPDYIPPGNVVVRPDGSRHIMPQSAQGPIQQAAAEMDSPVEILRGMQRSAISFGNGAPGSTREWRTDLPVLASGSLQDRLNYVAELYGKEGAQVGDAAARLLLGEANNQTSLGVANIQGATSRDVAGTQAGAHIRGAEISAAAQRYGIDAKPDIPQVKEIEEDVVGPDGRPMLDPFTRLPARKKRSVQWDGQQWQPVSVSKPERTISAEDDQRILEAMGGDQRRAAEYKKTNGIRVHTGAKAQVSSRQYDDLVAAEMKRGGVDRSMATRRVSSMYEIQR